MLFYFAFLLISASSLSSPFHAYPTRCTITRRYYLRGPVHSSGYSRWFPAESFSDLRRSTGFRVPCERHSPSGTSIYCINPGILYDYKSESYIYFPLGPFTLRFEGSGQVSCLNYQQSIIEQPVKNVNITFTGFTIETTSTLPLFYGDCYFTLENIDIPQLSSPLVVTRNEGGVLLRDLTIGNVLLGADQNIIDQDSRDRLEADYLILDTVVIRNTNVNAQGETYATIRSFIQYRLVEVRNSVFEGIGFVITGEQVAGNLKTDISVQNVTMSNSRTFLLIESYGTAIIENSVFRNATGRAVHFALTDENLSPIDLQISNCLFEENTDNYAGAALTFQSSYETNEQFSLKGTISNSRFIRNTVSFAGGAMAFLFLANTDVLITDCEFTGNVAIEAAGAVYVNKGEPGMRIAMRNSIFDSNSAFTGGVFSLDFLTGPSIDLDNNQYRNNSAELEGGIGYVTESIVTLTDSSSYATENKAEFQGGGWSLESNANVTFDSVTFENNEAFLRGGCIVNTGASLTLINDVFRQCEVTSVSSLGGAVHVGDGGTILVEASRFSNNVADFGASIAIQSLQESQVIQGSTFSSDFSQFERKVIQSQVYLGYGNVLLEGNILVNLSTPFFEEIAGSAQLRNTNVQSIQCEAQADLVRGCLVELDQTSAANAALVITGITADSIISNVPVFRSFRGNISLNAIRITAAQIGNEQPIADLTQSAWSASDLQFPPGSFSFRINS